MGRDKRCIQDLVEISEGRDHYKASGVDGRIILK
jgi:hypothetical protein